MPVSWGEGGQAKLPWGGAARTEPATLSRSPAEEMVGEELGLTEERLCSSQSSGLT